jgi:hypothetical protein
MAAGLGFKTFTTGEVLTAADTNGYLMQGLLVFADAAARDAAITSPQEGQACYLKDTDAVLTYSGTAWVGFDDSNAIQNAIVDAKGDLISATGNDTPARLAVGNDGETLVADSAATTGLRWQGDYAAGKNKIINGNMVIDQRNAGASVTVNTAGSTFTVDRWRGTGQATDGVFTLQQDSSAPAGFTKSIKATVTTADASIASTQVYFVAQALEGNTVADFDFGLSTAKTITLSFWVRSSLTGTFGGSLRNSAADRSYPFSYSISVADTWEKKSVTIAGDTTGTWVKDSGKGIDLIFSLGAGTDRLGTAGAWNSNNNIGATGQTNVIGTLSATWYSTGVQVEIGNVATAFQTATGTIQGELAACQRYYYRNTATNVFGMMAISAFNPSTTVARLNFQFPVVMRTEPTVLDYSSILYQDFSDATFATSSPTIDTSITTKYTASVNTVVSGATALNSGRAIANNNAAAFVGFSAEL